MYFNKKVIKIVGSTLIFLVIFTFSVVLAVDDSIYVWSSETEPLTSETSAEVENNKKNELSNGEKNELKEYLSGVYEVDDDKITIN